ncbi:hypothetical protein D3C72_1826530 [compost metagenome]
MLSATIRAQNRAAMNIFTPRSAMKISKPKPTSNPAFPSIRQPPLIFVPIDHAELQRMLAQPHPGPNAMPLTHARCAG